MSESQEQPKKSSARPMNGGEKPQGAAKNWATQDLSKRLGVLGFALLCVIVDFLFVLAWVWIHHMAEALFHWIGDLPGMEGVVVNILKWLFTVATLSVLVAYVVRDVVGSAVRIWKSA
ncbi:hypothetical protein [Streptomyces sp. NRRL S-146]|uniref:hypothetical protein n=1 Tax=Streptomyces sp. NRRL S-146 TaxID=1463884 RepID=UPI00131D0C8A|nr:hypothetical protein [Streptomyces sp. NRRL S-146]